MERHGRDFWKRRIAEQESRGQSIGEYCERQGLARSTFARWRKRLSAATNNDLVEIRSEGTPARGLPLSVKIDVT
jgi:transposase-like protein